MPRQKSRWGHRRLLKRARSSQTCVARAGEVKGGTAPSPCISTPRAAAAAFTRVAAIRSRVRAYLGESAVRDASLALAWPAAMMCLVRPSLPLRALISVDSLRASTEPTHGARGTMRRSAAVLVVHNPKCTAHMVIQASLTCWRHIPAA